MLGYEPKRRSRRKSAHGWVTRRKRRIQITVLAIGVGVTIAVGVLANFVLNYEAEPMYVQ